MNGMKNTLHDCSIPINTKGDSMTTSAKQKPNVAVRLSDDLEQYLREKAAVAHRTLTGEIRMRLELTRQLDQRPAEKGMKS
jgi:hypothetical protein